MSKWFLSLGLVGLALLFFVGCEQVNVPPDIVISSVNPIAFYVNDYSNIIEGVTVTISPKNSVDSYLDYIQWEYYDKDNAQVGTTSQPFHIYVLIPGKRDTVTRCSTSVTNLSIPVQEIVNNMVQKNHFSSSVRLIFTATSQYNSDQQDTASCYIGLYRMITYSCSLSINKDSLAIGDSATVTATVLDNSGRGVANDTVNFTVDLGCTITPQAITNASGRAFATLKAGTTTGYAKVTAMSRKGGLAELLVKIY